jgi:hypothetical protein
LQVVRSDPGEIVAFDVIEAARLSSGDLHAAGFRPDPNELRPCVQEISRTQRRHMPSPRATHRPARFIFSADSDFLTALSLGSHVSARTHWSGGSYESAWQIDFACELSHEPNGKYILARFHAGPMQSELNRLPSSFPA